jgi:hypothetical protein
MLKQYMILKPVVSIVYDCFSTLSLQKKCYGAGTPVIEMRVLSGITHAQGVCASYAGP